MGGSRWRALAVAATAAALAIAPVAPSGAQTPPAGTGTSSGTTSVLRAVLGTDQLVLRLLGEDSVTTNDPTSGPRATERLSPLQLTSSLVPALDGVSVPASETSSTSGENTTSAPPVDLGTLVAGSPVPGLLTGTIDPASLRAAVDASGATSSADAAIQDLSVLAGLVSLGTATADLGSTALVGDASSVRGLVIDELEVLDLTALLEALGISLGDLPLDTLLGLLDGLGLALPDGFASIEDLTTALDGLLDDTGAVRTQVTALQEQIAGLEDDLAAAEGALATANAEVATLTAQIAEQTALLSTCGVPLVCDPISALIATLTAELTTAQAEVTTLTGTIATLNGQIDDLLDQIDALLDGITDLVDELTGLLDGILGALDGAPLVTVSDLVVGVTATADDTVASSVATVVASFGDIKVGTASLGGLGPDALLAQVTALAGQVTTTLDELLGAIAPALSGVVDIDLLDKTASIVQEGAGTRATAGVTALRATVTPPDVCAVLQDLFEAPETLGDVLTGLGVEPPALPGPVGSVLDTLGSTVTCELVPPGPVLLLVPAAVDADGVAAALTQPLRLEAASVAGTALFALPAATSTTASAPQGSLPRTGGDAVWAVLAVALGAGGLAARRLLRRATPTT